MLEILSGFFITNFFNFCDTDDKLINANHDINESVMTFKEFSGQPCNLYIL